MPDSNTDIAKLCVFAAIFWLGGTIIFLIAAYKVYQPKQLNPNINMNCGCMP